MIDRVFDLKYACPKTVNHIPKLNAVIRHAAHYTAPFGPTLQTLQSKYVGDSGSWTLRQIPRRIPITIDFPAKTYIKAC